MTLAVVLEVAAKRSFASALDWPGWSRAGRSPEEAVARLVEYGPRYALVADHAGIPFEAPGSADEVQITERLRGSSGTEFGVPSAAARAEEHPIEDDLDRLLALLRAAWAAFDDAARAAEGRRLTVGPRGGGRDLARMTEHVRGAEEAYLRQLGSRPPPASDRPVREQLDELRALFLEALSAVARGEALPNPRRTQKVWSPRYAVRRSAWHALDHAWELQDRAVVSRDG